MGRGEEQIVRYRTNESEWIAYDDVNGECLVLDITPAR